jgi:hypothetical protein
MTRYFLSVLVALIAAPRLTAQIAIPASQTMQFALIRVDAPAISNSKVVGRVRSIDANALALVSKDSTIVFARNDITGLERWVSAPPGRSMLHGAALGALAGFVVARVYVATHYDNQDYATLGSLIYGGGPGLIVGGVIGAGLARGVWVEFKVQEWLEN